METHYIISYDHGSSAMKTYLISTKGEIIGSAVKPLSNLFPKSGYVEQDPNDWWEKVCLTTRELLEKNLVPVDNIKAISSSNPFVWTSPVDKKGHVLYNSITFMDTRGAQTVKNYFGKGLFKISGYNLFKAYKYLKKTGVLPGLSGKDSHLTHILWFKDNMPDIYDKTWKFMDCKDFLNWKMTGQVATTPDCIWLMAIYNVSDINNMFFDPSLYKSLKIDLNKIPEVKGSTEVLGTLTSDAAKELGLQMDVKVIMGSGDIAAATIGSGAINPSQAHLYVGSSSWIVAPTKNKKTNIFNFIASMPGSIPELYFAVGQQETAGANLNWFKDKIIYWNDGLTGNPVEDVFRKFDDIVQIVPPGSNGCIFTPWLTGESTPYDDHTIRGSFNNINLLTSRADMIRAIFEGVAFNAKSILLAIEKTFKIRLEPITFIGGGANSDVWCQMFSDIFERRIIQPVHPQDVNALGAAYMAMVSLGYIDWSDIPNMIMKKKEYLPNSNNFKIYNSFYQEFRKIYDNNKKMYGRLNS